MSQKPLILAVETSGRIGSVAIASGQKLLAAADFSGRLRHSAEIFPAIIATLKDFGRKPKDIEHVYISAGPGSFTGLRIATTLAKTMHLANKAKIVALDTLDVIAANAIDLTTDAPNYEKIAAILDAKRGQFFIAVYQRNTSNATWNKILPDSLMTASQFLDKFVTAGQSIWLLGEGLVYHAESFRADGVQFVDKSRWPAKAEKVHLLGWKMAQAGQFADPLLLKPTYLRRPEAEEKWGQHKIKG
jgi:tRNA threonylcarbamoyladenosine biosynthesis protein TsaB